MLSFDSALEENLQQLRNQFHTISVVARPSKEHRNSIHEIASTRTQARKHGEHAQQIQDDLESARSRLVNDGLDPAPPRSSLNKANPKGNNPRGKALARNHSSLRTPAMETVNHSEPVPYAVDDSTFLNILCPSHLLSSSTSPFRETSFERRLHRACLKNGYHLLVDPTTDPDNVSRVFRLPLTLSTRDSIVQKVKGLLEGGLDEAPEMWDMPFFLLGGAGTHYPRRDHIGKPILPPNALPVSKLIGAFVHKNTDPQSFHNDHDLLANLGLDGEWLDSYDVEGYLREKGIFLSADTAFCRVPARAFSMESRPSDIIGANARHVMATDESAHRHMLPHNVDLIELQSRGRGSDIQFSPAQDVDLLRNYSDPNGPWVLDVGLFIDRMSLSESKSVAITLWQEQISFSLAFASVAVLRFAEKTSSIHSVLHCVETSWILPCDIFIFTELSLCLQDVHSCCISKPVPLSG